MLKIKGELEEDYKILMNTLLDKILSRASEFEEFYSSNNTDVLKKLNLLLIVSDKKKHSSTRVSSYGHMLSNFPSAPGDKKIQVDAVLFIIDALRQIQAVIPDYKAEATNNKLKYTKLKELFDTIRERLESLNRFEKLDLQGQEENIKKLLMQIREIMDRNQFDQFGGDAMMAITFFDLECMCMPTELGVNKVGRDSNKENNKQGITVSLEASESLQAENFSLLNLS